MSVQIDGSTGNIIAIKADYSGDVSIGGTLTYEDVTNVDSVGIITARSGVNVTGGSVGIGTDSPVSGVKLHLQDTSACRLQLSTDNTGHTSSDGVRLMIDGSDNFEILQRENANIEFFTNNSERLRINSSGQLLIGTTAARTNFNDSSIETRLQIEVAGNDDSAALSIISNAGTSNSDKRSGLLVLGRTRGTSIGSNTVVVQDDQVGMIEFKGMDGTSFTTAASIKAQVDAAVGTDDMPGRLVFSTTADNAATPTERMRIDSSGMIDVKSGDLRVTGGEGISAALYLVADQGDDNGDSWRIISNQDANDLTISNNDSGSFSDLFTFTKAGHLGVGHGSPQFGITIAQSSNDIGAIGWEDGGNTKRASIRCDGADDALQFHTGSSDSERMSIQSNGRVNMFHVYGTALSGTMRDVYIEDGGQLGYSSSTRDSKANISLLSNVDWLYQLQPSSFNFKKRDKNGEYTGEVSTELEYGLIAEDVEPIAPELCFYDEVEGEMELSGIHYKKLIVPLLKALQEANTKITALETKVAALEG